MRTGSNPVTVTKTTNMNPTSYSIHQEHRNRALEALEKAKKLEEIRNKQKHIKNESKRAN